MWKIAELISELNASAQIAYTLFQTYFKSYNVHPPTCEITYTLFESLTNVHPPTCEITYTLFESLTNVHPQSSAAELSDNVHPF